MLVPPSLRHQPPYIQDPHLPAGLGLNRRPNQDRRSPSLIQIATTMNTRIAPAPLDITAPKKRPERVGSSRPLSARLSSSPPVEKIAITMVIAIILPNQVSTTASTTLLKRDVMGSSPQKWVSILYCSLCKLKSTYSVVDDSREGSARGLTSHGYLKRSCCESSAGKKFTKDNCSAVPSQRRNKTAKRSRCRSAGAR